MPRSLADQDRRQRALLLAGIALASIIAWQTALGSLLLYPFTILAAWFHEMGHGLAAMLAGRGFERLLIFRRRFGRRRVAALDPYYGGTATPSHSYAAAAA